MDALLTNRILLCSDDPLAAQDLRHQLERAGHAVGQHPLDAGEPADLSSYGLIVLDGGRNPDAALALSRRLHQRRANGFIPVLFVIGDHSPAARLASLQAGADTYLLRPFVPDELLAQVQAFLRLKEIHQRLSEKTGEVQRIHQQLHQAYQQINQELELARRIQMSFLPQTLPETPQVRFAVEYRPCGRVGGDFYDVFRLDEEHFGFYIADAMGHGVPASLLTIFLKRGVRAKEIIGKQYRLVPPDEVLQKLNRDLIEQALAENPFITMIYGLLNFCDGTLRYARAGHPHPIYLPHGGEPQTWPGTGSLLGVFETEFPPQTRQLRPGDQLLLYTDGWDTSGAAGIEKLTTAAGHRRGLPIADCVSQLAQDLLGQSSQPDDFTLLGLEMVE